MPGYQSDQQANSVQLPAGEVQNGQVFAPGTVTYDAAGEITRGMPAHIAKSGGNAPKPHGTNPTGSNCLALDMR